MIPGIGGPISGGAGGIDLSGGPATAESGSDSNTGGATFNFAPPESVQRVQQYSQTGLYLVIALVVIFVLMRGK